MRTQRHVLFVALVSGAVLLGGTAAGEKGYVPKLQAPMQTLLASNMAKLQISPMMRRHLEQFTTPRAFTYDAPMSPGDKPVRKLGASGYQAARLTRFKPWAIQSAVDIRQASANQNTWDLALTVRNNDFAKDRTVFTAKQLANGNTLEVFQRTFDSEKYENGPTPRDKSGFTVRSPSGALLGQGTLQQLQEVLSSKGSLSKFGLQGASSERLSTLISPPGQRVRPSLKGVKKAGPRAGAWREVPIYKWLPIGGSRDFYPIEVGRRRAFLSGEELRLFDHATDNATGLNALRSHGFRQ